jgi:hypothetical protein
MISPAERANGLKLAGQGKQVNFRISFDIAVLGLIALLPAEAQPSTPGESRLLRSRVLPELGHQLTVEACAGSKVLSVAEEDGEFIVQIEPIAGGAEPGPAPATQPCEYKFAEATRHGQWEREINRVAAEGFRLVATLVTEKGGNDFSEWFVALLSRTAAPEERYDYRILEGPHAGRIEKKLTWAGAEGFRLLPFAFHKHTREWTWAMSNQHLLLVLERKAGRPGCGARVLDTRQESTMEKELAQAEAEGYEPVHKLEHVGHFVAFLEQKDCRGRSQ